MLTDVSARARRILRADLWVAIAPSILIVAAAFGITMLFVKPAPPKHLTIAVAPDEGGSRYYARRYQEILKRHGVTLDVRQTGGSLANVQLLADRGSDVDVAFVQSGTEPGESGAQVVSLGSLNYIPLWVFYRGEEVEDVRQLKGRRIGVGGTGSGTRALAATLLGAAGADAGGTELLPLDRDAAIEQVKRFYQAGVPFLQRYLPFWAANLVDRLWVMLVPIIAVAVPLGRAVPAIYRWRVRSRVFRWYARLKQIELQLEEDPGRQALDDMLRRLEDTERAVNQIPTPLAYAENLYFFREHVDVVRRRILRRLANEPESRPGADKRVGYTS